MSLARDIPNVLASFRTTRRDMWDWGAVNSYAFEAELGASLLADMADDYGAEGVIPVVQKRSRAPSGSSCAQTTPADSSNSSSGSY